MLNVTRQTFLARSETGRITNMVVIIIYASIVLTILHIMKHLTNDAGEIDFVFLQY